MSHVIIAPRTGYAVGEVFDLVLALRYAGQGFRVVPAREYLLRFDRLVERHDGCQPPPDALRAEFAA